MDTKEPLDTQTLWAIDWMIWNRPDPSAGPMDTYLRELVLKLTDEVRHLHSTIEGAHVIATCFRREGYDELADRLGVILEPMRGELDPATFIPPAKGKP